jgi:hypothetical protein
VTNATGSRHPRRLRPVVGVLAAALVVLLPACGGGGDDAAQPPAPPASSTSTAGPATDTAPAAPRLSTSEATRIANAMLLRLSDFPTGWRAGPADEEEGCAGVGKLSDRYDVLAKAKSKDFASGNATSASSSAGVVADSETARAALNYLEASIQSDAFRDCLNDYLGEQNDEDVTFGKVEIAQVSFPVLGDRSSAWEVVVPVEARGLSVTAYVDVVYIRARSALSVIVFSDVFSPFDTEMRERLARAVAKRMDAAAPP